MSEFDLPLKQMTCDAGTLDIEQQKTHKKSKKTSMCVKNIISCRMSFSWTPKQIKNEATGCGHMPDDPKGSAALCMLTSYTAWPFPEVLVT